MRPNDRQNRKAVAPRIRRRPSRRRPLVEAMEDRTLLATFAVDIVADEADGNTAAGDLSLREAILLANANPGPDRIEVPAGTYRLSILGAGEQAGRTGDLDLFDSVEIAGAGAGSTTIDANAIDRIFDIFLTSGGARPVVVLSGLTLVGGQTPNGLGSSLDGGAISINSATVTVQDCIIRGNATGGAGFGGRGGGINADLSELTVLRSVIDGNRTGNGTGVGGDGGGIAGNASIITIGESTVSNNRTGVATGGAGSLSAGRGGGIYSESGVPSLPGLLTIVDSDVVGNATGSTASSKGMGGGIYNYSGSALKLERATVRGNAADVGGGVMTDNGTDGHILDSTIADNTAEGGRGGGLAIWVSRVSMISGTTISGNVVRNADSVYYGGGGIYNNSSEIESGDGRKLVALVNSTIVNNTVSGTGPGSSYYAVGGGLLNTGSIDRVVNTTIAGNSAREGGGLFHATFANSTPVIGELVNALIADNTSSGSFAKDFASLGEVSVAENNLVEDPNGHDLAHGVAGNLVGVDPKLAALADNGGPTATMALLPGSPAIDAGRNAGAPTTDQRGVSRPQNGAVDIGAFEVQPAVNRAPVAVGESYTVAEDGVLVVPSPVGPVLRYGFDEASGGTANALDSGTAPPANASLLSGATRTANTPGGASRGALDLTVADFNSTYATAGDAQKVDGLGAMTVTLWVNLRSTPSDNDILLSDMPGTGDPGGTGGWELAFTSWNGGVSPGFTVYEQLSPGSVQGSGKILTGINADQTWAFVAITYSPEGFLLTYGGGESAPVAQTPGGGTLVDIPLRGNGSPLTIGRSSRQTTNFDSTPPAWFDDVRIYDRALSAAELEGVRQQALTRGVGVLANDSDPDGDPMTAALVSGPSHGNLTFFPDGTFHYLPNPDFHGTDSFTYKATDGALESAPATVTITVTPTNDAPVAQPDSYATGEDTPLTVPATAGLLANDSDKDGDPLAVGRIVVPPQLGTIVLNPDGSFTYTPLQNVYTFNSATTDRFLYVSSDGTAESSRAVVEIVINPANDPPLAVDDSTTVAEDGGPVAIPVLDNDSLQFDDYGAPAEVLAIVAVTQPSHGTAAFTATGLTYTPNPDFHGTDSFSYTITDSNGGGTDTATVTVTVTPVDDPPAAVDDTFSAVEDSALIIAARGVLANDRDADGDSLSAVLVDRPSFGTLTLNADGSFTYTPNADYAGADRFTYRASDGGPMGNIATVSIAVQPVNDPPALATIVDQEIPATQDTLTLTLSAVDPDGDAVSYSATAESLAYVLDRQLGLAAYHPGEDNWGGRGERWLTDAGGRWYFLLPNGELYRWSGSGVAGTLLGTPGAGYHADPRLLVDAQAGRPRAAVSVSGATLTVDREDGFAGAVVVTVTADDGRGGTDSTSFTVVVTPGGAAANRAPVLEAIADIQVPSSQDVVTIPLSAVDPDGDAVSYAATAESLAYVLDRQLGLRIDGGNLWENWGGRGARWLLGDGNLWYFILPDGALYRWDGTDGQAVGELVGVPGAACYADPALLVDAQPGRPHAAVTVTGSTLTVDPEDDFDGSLVVTVTASDGKGGTDSKSFVVTVTTTTQSM